MGASRALLRRFRCLAAQAVIYLLAKYGDLTVNAQSAGILDVLVFGASTDYALLLVARYREELRRHDRRDAAMAEALRRAGPAIFASASTVIIALLVLLVAELQSTKDLGPVLAIGVAVSLLAMLTLLPALLVVVPRGVFWPYRPGYGSSEPTHSRTLGPRRVEHRAPASDRLDHHGRRPRRDGDRPGRAEGQRPDERAVLPRSPRFRGRRVRAGQALPGWGGPARRRDQQGEPGSQRCAPRSQRHRESPT